MIAARLARKHPGRIWVIKRPRKMGLGSAYVEGFRFALRGRFGPVIQMDADGSHDPAALPGINRALSRADVAVGSRYLGGLRIMNWPWTRLLLSVAANWYARLVTGVPVHDLTGGFNGLRRGILEKLDLDRLRCNGYAFQIALKYHCQRLGGRLVEVPITFAGRMRGESKLSRAVFLEAVFAVWRMRFGAL
jgi:dolichol-phosphate mannosyltransferase